MANKILFVIAFGFGAWILVDILGVIVGGLIIVAIIIVLVANLKGTEYHQSKNNDGQDTNLHQNKGIMPGGYDNDNNDGGDGGGSSGGCGGGCGGAS
ncbi:MAG: hypothetical protein QM487_15380 [Candidatus Marithrix sp.]